MIWIKTDNLELRNLNRSEPHKGNIPLGSLATLSRNFYEITAVTCCSRRWSSAAAAKSLQSCPTPCDPIDGSPPDSPVPGILQARTLEWVAISFSNAWKWKVKVKSLSCVRLLVTPRTAAHQAPPSMGFSRQEYWSGVPLPSPDGLLANFKEQTSKFITMLGPVRCELD